MTYDYRLKSSGARKAPLPGRGRPVFGTNWSARICGRTLELSRESQDRFRASAGGAVYHYQ